MANLHNALPPGWDCKRDEQSGKLYYVNHYTKTTTWEDPRERHRHLNSAPKPKQTQAEYIPLQHGTPESRRNYVYPSQTSPLPAFQILSNSSPKSVHLQDMRPKMSPLSVRSPKVQDSSITIEKPDDIVAKVAAMFPTVPETYIRILLKKYHSREALVISALQVEKYPITTPGPFATPPPQRNIHQPVHATPPLGFRVCSRGGSPGCRSWGSPAATGLRSSPRPHSSPKLKLRYMKSIFPQADEMVILDILQNNENNIQKTSEQLKEMGFDRTDTVKIAQQKLEVQQENERLKEENQNEAPPTLPPRLKTADEKQRVTAILQEKYKDVAEHLIFIALESVNFDEERANQILQIMLQEDKKPDTTIEIQEDTVDTLNLPSTSSACDLPVSQSRQSLKSLLKAEKEIDKVVFSRVIEEDISLYKSPNLSNTQGSNPIYAKGPNEKLLLEDYVKWQGPNTALFEGSRKLAKGPNPALLCSDRTYKPCGANRSLIKGPQCGLAKGSIFSQFKAVVVGESRGE